MREELGPRESEKRLLRKKFGSERDEVSRKWRRLHMEELRDLYYSLHINRVIKWTEHAASVGKWRDACRVVVEKPQGKRPLGRSRRRWDYNVNAGVKEIVRKGVNCIDLSEVQICGRLLRARRYAFVFPNIPGIY